MLSVHHAFFCLVRWGNESIWPCGLTTYRREGKWESISRKYLASSTPCLVSRISAWNRLTRVKLRMYRYRYQDSGAIAEPNLTGLHRSTHSVELNMRPNLVRGPTNKIRGTWGGYQNLGPAPLCFALNASALDTLVQEQA